MFVVGWETAARDDDICPRLSRRLQQRPTFSSLPFCHPPTRDQAERLGVGCFGNGTGRLEEGVKCGQELCPTHTHRAVNWGQFMVTGTRVQLHSLPLLCGFAGISCLAVALSHITDIFLI